MTQAIHDFMKYYTGESIPDSQNWLVVNKKLEDMLEALSWFEGLQFHASISDWPYNLESITKRFGIKGSKPPKSGPEARKVAGFMGQAWDSDIAYHPELWQAMQAVHLPGALHFGFSYPSKEHRLICAMEDAGMITRPSFYNYGQGVAQLPTRFGWAYGSGKQNGTNAYVDDETELFYSYHKPQVEPIVLAQFPIETKTIKATVQRYGTGCINKTLGSQFMASEESHRFPGHLLLTHHPECEPKRVKLETIAGATSAGYQKTHKNVYGKYNPNPNGYNPGNGDGYETITAYTCHESCRVGEFLEQAGEHRGERYFMQSHWLYESFEKLNDANPLVYCGKPGTKERNAGLDSYPQQTRQRANPGGLANDPKFAPTQQENNHPCLKPINLTKYLCSLLLPSPKFSPRLLFVPCSGTGSEMIGGLLAGWDFVIGVEMTESYADIARGRLRFWQQRMSEVGPYVDSVLGVCDSSGKLKETKQQMRMF